jgi:hypothetical protein
MLPPRSACFVEETLLRDQHKGALGYFSARDFAFCCDNFVDRAAEMNCAGALANFRSPGNWRAQCIINFENSWRVPKVFESPTITRRQFMTRDAEELPG